MRQRSTTVLGAFIFAAVVALGIPSVSMAATAASASVTPANSLRDGQVVTVTGAGFDPDSQVGMDECLTGATGPTQCDPLGTRFATTGGAGSFSVAFTVTRVINVGGSLTDCAAPLACEVGMAETDDITVSAVVEISFERVPIVPPAVVVNPSTDLLDGQTVQVTGSGFTPGATAALVECPADSPPISACDLFTGLFVSVDSSGALDTPYQVVRVITVNGSSLDCAGPTACVLSVGNVDDFDQRSVVPIAFGPQQTPTTVNPTTYFIYGPGRTFRAPMTYVPCGSAALLGLGEFRGPAIRR